MAQNLPVDVHLYIENYDDHGMPRPTTSSASSPGPGGSTFPRLGSAILPLSSRSKPPPAGITLSVFE
jgi:hypothetical protein